MLLPPAQTLRCTHTSPPLNEDLGTFAELTLTQMKIRVSCFFLKITRDVPVFFPSHWRDVLPLERVFQGDHYWNNITPKRNPI